MKKIVFALLTVLAMAFMLLPVSALTAGPTLADGDSLDLSTGVVTHADSTTETLTISGGDIISIPDSAGVTVTGSNTDIRISCGAGVSVTLDGVTITNSTHDYCPITFTGTGNALVLTGVNTLVAGEGQPAVSAESGVALTISGDGSLSATGGEDGAGIGGGYRESGGSITIESGAVTAIGGKYGAGIGGGYESADGGIIMISGGTVIATGGDNGAGIGGGHVGGGGSITISGSANVTATSGDLAAGIGGGWGGSGGTIKIEGGIVNATAVGSNGYGAGIGGGNNGDGGDITISGSADVTATGRENGAGIGGGSNGDGGDITILDSPDVTATGGENGAGIGGGAGGSGGTIKIEGGTVYASGQDNDGAGIGGGDEGGTGNITISGGDITAIGADYGAGIGSGWDGDSGTITITGGDVDATGGIYAAGIGGGEYTAGGTIDISGGIVEARGGYDGAGIGGGEEADGGDITIFGSADVTAIGGENGAGVGGGAGGSGGTIMIEGGTVYASGEDNDGAGIGGGDEGGAGNITISGGDITAIGADYGAGIGSGWDGDSGTITISGGAVDATGGIFAAGIGGGEYTDGGTINISGGIVAARGGYNAAGIGGGEEADGGDIAISGSADVMAIGDESGAGIGGGYFGSGGSIKISGGNVAAYGGLWGAGIGSGDAYEATSSVDGGSITISGGTVNATGGADKAAGIGGGDSAGGGEINIIGGIVYAIKDSTGSYDIGSGDSGAVATITISGDAAVLLGTDSISPAPTTATHTHYSFTEDADEAYGISIPTEWTPTFGAYLILRNLDYDANGGSSTGPASVTQQAGTTAIVEANSFTNSGYDFDGWNTAADGSGAAYNTGDTFTFTADTTLYAQWKVQSVTPTPIPSTPSGGSGGTASAAGDIELIITFDSNRVMITANLPGASFDDESLMQEIIETARSLEDKGYIVIVKIDVPDSILGDFTFTLNGALLSDLADSTEALLQIGSQSCSIRFDADALESLSSQAGMKDITVGISQVSHAVLAASYPDYVGLTVYDISVSAGGTNITTFGSGEVTVTVPYTPTQEELDNGIVVYYISEDGPVMMTSCKYDADTGTVSFVTNHLSKFAVGYMDARLTEDEWYVEYFNYLEARGIMDAHTFSPDSNITRAEFVTILAKIDGVDLSGYTEPTFEDVSADDTYFGAVGWAAANEIILGYNGLFSPMDSITRQDICTILMRYANVNDFMLPQTVEAKAFTDDAFIAAYAADAVAGMQQAGILDGFEDGSFRPAGNTTQAQAAKIFSVFMQLMIEY